MVVERLARVGSQVMWEGGGIGKVMGEGNSGKPGLGFLAEGKTSGQGGTSGQVRHLVGEIISMHLVIGMTVYFVFWTVSLLLGCYI